MFFKFDLCLKAIPDIETMGLYLIFFTSTEVSERLVGGPDEPVGRAGGPAQPAHTPPPPQAGRPTS